MTPSSLARLVRLGVMIALVPALSAQTFTVGGSRADFATIQEAVEAVPSGGIVLVRPGPFQGAEPLTIDGKTLTLVVRDPSRRVVLDGGILIQNLAVDQSVTLIGFESSSFEGIGGLTVNDCDGTVWIEDCRLEGPFITFFADPSAVFLDNANDVIFVRSEIVGGNAGQLGPVNGSAIDAIDSSIHLFDTNVIGGAARSSADVDGFPGGDGIRLDGGFLFARNGTLTGGDGGYVGTPFSCANLVGGIGGPGLHLVSLLGSDPEAFLVDITLVSGAGGGATPPCIPGSPGRPLVVEAGAVTTFSDIPRAITADSIVSPFDSTALTITGNPGELTWLLISEDPMTNFVEEQLGTEALDEFFQIPIGTIAPNGELVFVLPPVLSVDGTYPDWYGGSRIYVQSLTLDTGTSEARLSSPSAIVVRPPDPAGFYRPVRDQAQSL